MDHWLAKAAEEALTEQNVGDEQYMRNGKMRPEDKKTTADEQIEEHAQMK